MTPSTGSVPGIWNRGFLLLLLASALGYAHFGLLGPIIPLYVSSLGHSEWVVGLVVAAFSFTSFLIRPFLGYLADTWSVRGVLSLGALLMGLSALVFVTPFLLVLGMVNAVRGIGWAALNTGANTVLAHTAPSGRRAEAAGYLAVSHSGPALLAPPVALWMLTGSATEYGPIFLLAALAGLASAALSWTIPTPPQESPQAPATSLGSAGHGATGVKSLVDRAVLLPTVLLVCLALVQPAITAFVPLFARQLGISLESLAWYYLAAGATALLGRVVLGRLADRAGRGVALMAGFLLAMLGLVLFATASSLLALVVAGIFFALGSALNQPTTTALAIDRADPRRRGRAMASFSLGNQVGAGFGALLTGALAELLGYSAMYALLLLPPTVGLALVVLNWRALRPLRAGAE